MLRVLAFTDEFVLAAGLKQVLTQKNGFQLVKAVADPSELTKLACSQKPDLALVDLTDDLTFDVLWELQERIPSCRVVLWVRNIPTGLAHQAVENGVRGILRKTLPAESLLKCLRMVADGGLWFEDSLNAKIMAARAVNLSKRESQLVTLLSQGLKNKEIASLLFLSEGSVKVYLSRLFKKLDVNDRFELALYGLRNLPSAERISDDGVSCKPPKERKAASRSEWLHSLLLDRPGVRVRA